MAAKLELLVRRVGFCCVAGPGDGERRSHRRNVDQRARELSVAANPHSDRHTAVGLHRSAKRCTVVRVVLSPRTVLLFTMFRTTHCYQTSPHPRALYSPLTKFTCHQFTANCVSRALARYGKIELSERQFSMFQAHSDMVLRSPKSFGAGALIQDVSTKPNTRPPCFIARCTD